MPDRPATPAEASNSVRDATAEASAGAAVPDGGSEHGAAESWDRRAEKARIDAEQAAKERRKRREAEEAHAVAVEQEARRPARRFDQLDYAVLVICTALGGASGDDIQVVAEEWNVELGAVEGTIYNRLRRLKDEGLLSVEKQPGRRGRQRTVYHADGDALRLIRDWQQSEAAVPRFDGELFVRLLAGATGPAGHVTAGLLPLLKLLKQRIAELEVVELATSKRAGGYSLVEELAFDLEKALLRTYLSWLGRAIKALPQSSDPNHDEEVTVSSPVDGARRR